MSASLNKVMIIGNLGKEPEIKYLPDGTATGKLSVAVNREWKNTKGERCKETEWFNVVTWRKTAENCAQYCYKGQSVYVEGRLATRKWTDQQGVERTVVELIASDVRFLGKPKAQAAAEGEASDDSTPSAPDEEVAF